MAHQRVSAEFETNFEKAKNVFAADANLPQTPPHTCRKDNRKCRHKPVLNRKAIQASKFRHMTRDMAQKHRPAKSFLLPFGNSSE